MVRLAPVVSVLATLSCADMPSAPAASTGTAAADQAGPISYVALVAGDELRVRLHAYGCYHDVRFELTFRPVGDSLVAVTTRQEPGGPLHMHPMVSSDTVISRSALASLDRELAIYRTPSEDSCTSQSDLELAHYRAGAEVRRERYHLGSCRFFEEGPPVTMSSLAYRE